MKSITYFFEIVIKNEEIKSYVANISNRKDRLKNCLKLFEK